MTRSEAAQICQSIKFMMDKEDYSEAVEEALNMAIAALDQEETLQNLTKPNKSDLISRQAAIDTVMGFMPSLTTPDGCGQFDREIFEAQEMFVDIGQALNKLPSAQPFTTEQIQTMQELESAQVEKAYELGKADRPKWIPCSERLPENGEKVLCQTITKKGQINMVIGFYDFERWCCGMNSNVIAWMPLPEAYREDGEEE